MEEDVDGSIRQSWMETSSLWPVPTTSYNDDDDDDDDVVVVAAADDDDGTITSAEGVSEWVSE